MPLSSNQHWEFLWKKKTNKINDTGFEHFKGNSLQHVWLETPLNDDRKLVIIEVTWRIIFVYKEYLVTGIDIENVNFTERMVDNVKNSSQIHN